MFWLQCRRDAQEPTSTRVPVKCICTYDVRNSVSLTSALGLKRELVGMSNKLGYFNISIASA